MGQRRASSRLGGSGAIRRGRIREAFISEDGISIFRIVGFGGTGRCAGER
jgi:hypothetical protein